jgi:hypothetical protein
MTQKTNAGPHSQPLAWLPITLFFAGLGLLAYASADLRSVDAWALFGSGIGMGAGLSSLFALRRKRSGMQ